MFVLIFGYAQSGFELTFGEDRLSERSYGIPQHLTRVGDTQATAVGEGTGSADRQRRIEAGAGSLYVIEAVGQCHLVGVNIGTVAEQLNAHTRGEIGGKILIVEVSAWDRMGLLTEQQRETVLRFTDLSFEIFLLCLHAQIVGLGTLHGGRAHTGDRLMLYLHDFPCVLGELLHVGNDLQLLVEHQQGVVHVGHIGDELGLHSDLIVFGLKHRDLGGTLGGSEVAKEIGIPTGADRQLIGLGRLAVIP